MIGSEMIGNLVLGGGTAPAARRTTIVEGLRQFLTDTAAACLASGAIGRAANVYYLRRPQSAADLPAVIIEKQGEDREDCLNEAAESATYRFSVFIWSTEPEETTALARAFRVALTCDDDDEDEGAGPERFPLYMLGRRVDSAWLDDESDDATTPDDGSDDWLYETQQTFSLIAEE